MDHAADTASTDGPNGLERAISAEHLVGQLVERLELLGEACDGQPSGLSTGFSELDDLTSGLHGGDLVIIAGKPSVGKSSLALSIAKHVALSEGIPIVFFTLETDKAQVFVRLTSLGAGICLQALRRGRLENDEWIRLGDFSGKLEGSKFIIDDSPGLNVTELMSRARGHASVTGRVGLIVVDYLQLMTGVHEEADSRAAEMGFISRSLKKLARSLDCAVIAISQVNRLGARANNNPQLGDIRDSGAIEEDADLVLFMCGGAPSERLNSGPSPIEIIIGKQRNGPVGKFKLWFDSAQLKFRSASA